MRSNNKKQGEELFGHEQVIEFLRQLRHPLKTEIEEVRKIILSASDQITEHIKWNAPSFCINNQDRITFNLHGKEGFRLIFHCGSKRTEYADKGPFFQDDTKLLDWITGDRAMIKFLSASDVENNRNHLIKVVTKWLEVTNNI